MRPWPSAWQSRGEVDPNIDNDWSLDLGRLMHISLTPELEKVVRKKIKSGLYNNASEVIREALRGTEGGLPERSLEKVRGYFDDPSRWRFRNDLFPCCQVASQGRHVILFRAQGKTLHIVRILHTVMDFPSHLKGNE